MSFINSFAKATNATVTENGGLTFCSTGNSVLNFFARIGGMRNSSEKEILDMFAAARNEDKELADSIVLYSRDVRNGGIGERRIGRILLKELAKIDPCKVKRNFAKIVAAGRWDDLFIFEGTPVESEMWDFVIEQLNSDIKDSWDKKPISLLAKWLPSPNTSSKETRRLARKFCNIMGCPEKAYRKTLAGLRRYLQIIERKMSLNEWDTIDFEKVPSLAMKKYSKSFSTHCEPTFIEYMEAVKNGEKKVNTSVLYPYDLVKPHLICCSVDYEMNELQWKNLPDYCGKHNVIVMADVSGSMTLKAYQPLATSVGLAIYFAEHNKGDYHGYYMTFTNKPSFIKIDDNASLKDKITQVTSTNIGYNTNLDRAFEAIYEMAVKSNDVPEALVVISDMEIDRYVSSCDGICEKWKKKYEKRALKAPKLILWNVEARNNHYLATSNENVAFVSGSSASTFKQLQTLITKDAYSAMVEILSKTAFQWN